MLPLVIYIIIYIYMQYLGVPYDNQVMAEMEIVIFLYFALLVIKIVLLSV